jgi:Leucine-rich repeat (LRR) protein
MSLDLSGLKITDDQLPLLARGNTRAEYRHLFLRDNHLTDDGLANYLKANPVWATLDLSGNPIVGSCIAELRNVSTLVLENIPLTDAILLSAISPTGFPGPTKKMVLSGNHVTSAVLNSVGQGVELGAPGITEAQLMNCNVQGFTSLILKGKSFDGSCFSTWHPRVFQLGLQGTGVTDETIRFLRNITGLQIIDLSDTEVTDACLLELRNVQFINLSGTKITYAGLQTASFANLQRIQIALGQYSVEEVRELKKSLPLVVGKSGE